MDDTSSPRDIAQALNADWYAELRTLTPGERLKLRMELTAEAKKAKRAKRNGERSR